MEPKVVAITAKMIDVVREAMKSAVVLRSEQTLTGTLHQVGGDLCRMGVSIIADEVDRDDAESGDGFTAIHCVDETVVSLMETGEIEYLGGDGKGGPGVQNKGVEILGTKRRTE
jgi:hypothetical protein